MANSFNKSIGREAAAALVESKWWIGKSDEEIVWFQLFVTELCMVYSDFHKAIESVLRRSVLNLEFGTNYEGIVKEFLGEKPAPSMQDIIDMIPEEKRFLIVM